jgi:glycerol-3-phosphate acyltransferase PlsX
MTPIALDAMGGDRAPAETVAGAVLAAADGVDVVLVGGEEVLKRELEALSASLPIVHAPESIDMGDDPARALREKPESSISVAARLVRDGAAGAFVSAGSTGAVMAAAAILIGRAPGVLRPTIASIIPTPGSPTLILDSGANLDVKAEHLIQFAVMGSVAAEVIFGKTRPRVGLLNNGEEPGKGRAVEKEVHRLLASAPVNFIGNVEGRDIGANRADVFVTDGFVGNITLKSIEGVASMVIAMVLEAFESLETPVRIKALEAIAPLRRILDYEETGGAHLLGVDGVVVIAHGSSSRVAVANALRQARDGVQRDLVAKMTARLALT